MDIADGIYLFGTKDGRLLYQIALKSGEIVDLVANGSNGRALNAFFRTSCAFLLRNGSVDPVDAKTGRPYLLANNIA